MRVDIDESLTGLEGSFDVGEGMSVIIGNKYNKKNVNITIYKTDKMEIVMEKTFKQQVRIKDRVLQKQKNVNHNGICVICKEN